MTGHKKMESSKFPERLGKARMAMNLTQAELAEKAELSTTTISEYETGKKQPTIASASSLALILNVSLDWLCGIGERSIERYPAMALYEAIERLQLSIKKASEGEIVLTYQDHGPKISASEIEKFFNRFKYLQTASKLYKGKPKGDEHLEALKQDLLDRFKNLPDLPLYSMVNGE